MRLNFLTQLWGRTCNLVERDQAVCVCRSERSEPTDQGTAWWRDFASNLSYTVFVLMVNIYTANLNLGYHITMRKVETRLVDREPHDLLQNDIRTADDVQTTFRNLEDQAFEKLYAVYIQFPRPGVKRYSYQVLSLSMTGEIVVKPPHILRAILGANCTHFLLVHNHPSGNPSPSQADRELIENIQEGARTLDFIMVDFVIVGYPDQKWSLFEEEGGTEYVITPHEPKTIRF